MSRNNQTIFFQTSTPKRRTPTPLPRSSTPNKFYNPIKLKIKDNSDSSKMIDQRYCQHYQMPLIKLDLLLYRPKTECYRHQNNIQQIWDI